jgi:SNF family Na+-dependent transporter
VANGKFSSVGGITKVIVGLFIVVGVLSFVSIVNNFIGVDLLKDIMAGRYVDEADLNLYDSLTMSIGSAQLVLLIVFLIIFLVWVYRTHKNLYHLNADELRFTPGWSVGWFFIPIANLVMPYRVMAETWRASDPHNATGDKLAWKNSKVSAIVGWWWALTIISSIVSGVISRFDPYLPEEYLDYIYTSLTADFITISWIIVTILMVRRISAFQDEKNRLLNEGFEDKGTELTTISLAAGTEDRT